MRRRWSRRRRRQSAARHASRFGGNGEAGGSRTSKRDESIPRG